MKKVVALDRTFPNYSSLEERLSGLDAQLVFAAEKDPASLKSLCKDAYVVITTFTQVTAEIIEGMENCDMIIRTGIGVDNIDVPAATKKNIRVSYVPDYCREEVADHTVALLLDIARKVSFCNKYTSQNWDLKKAMGFVPRLSMCTAGILGLGGIGKLIAARLKPFGIKVCAFDPYVKPEDFEKLEVGFCASEDEVYSYSDFVIVSGPLTESRYHMINEKTLAKMKKTAFLINTARGPLVDEAALIEALKNGTIAGAALDVFEKEPIENKELYALDNLIVTPHVAFYSMESLPDLTRKVFDEIIRSLKGEKLRNCVNIK